MIQRKQTIYLLIAFIAMVLNFIFPIAEFIGSGGHQVEYYIYKVVDLTPGIKLDMDTSFFMASTAFAGLVAIGSLITIFLYKNRILQVKILRMLVLFILTHIALIFFFSIPNLEKITGNPVEYDYVGISMPLVAFLMLILAIKGILSDERLVRSADRLR